MPAYSPYPVPENKRKWHSDEELSDLSDAESDVVDAVDLERKLDECLSKLDELLAMLKPNPETLLQSIKPSYQSPQHP